ncbi:HNH endonuclease [Paraferrimonas haliotis]|uniref:HNH endonuclease n=1 Tax=Paraferrimonas haliotis TaxID=2013866 RepID=UPI000F7B3AC0|nr:HNH endonuclease signature motif containing protein [Paraferrimonas haliotis]
MARKNPTPKQRKNLLEKNAYRCCVCKQSGIGFELHHIDGDNSNTVESNLALLCVSDHDNHHRPDKYTHKIFCKDLRPEVLTRYKNRWEDFVAEAKKDSPEIIATLNIYGFEDFVHSMKLVMQRKDGSIEYEQLHHIHFGTPEDWVDDILKEVTDIGKNITVAIVNTPLEVELCPEHKKSYSQTIDECMATKITAADWDQKSSLTIYINPQQPSLALTVFYDRELIFSASLHKCQNKYLHLESDGPTLRNKIARKPSIRTQVTDIVQDLINTWEPALIFCGTGDPEDPELLDSFTLPKLWEKRY